MQEVIINIENGVPTVSVKGVPGKACRDLTASLEAKLGEVKTRKDTPDANLPTAKHQTQTKTQ
jgi:hypothetical protein